ncbi:MAG: hypothetical protein NZ561_10660, partial [Phycisphaerae bacterium]|nr:hypothetical protein [Phycisphaerae bacterium]MDW8263137.1 hypothetical protein [Phycisphaerales bacterium]
GREYVLSYLVLQLAFVGWAWWKYRAVQARMAVENGDAARAMREPAAGLAIASETTELQPRR